MGEYDKIHSMYVRDFQRINKNIISFYFKKQEPFGNMIKHEHGPLVIGITERPRG